MKLHTNDVVLSGLYSYTIDAMVAICLSFGLICMRLSKRSYWNTWSNSNRWFSLASACIVLCANLFPVIASWIPGDREQLGTSIPWLVIPTTGWALILSGFFYWLVFAFIVPLFMSGRQLIVKRFLIIEEDDEGNLVQAGELIDQAWVVPPATQTTSGVELSEIRNKSTKSV